MNRTHTPLMESPAPHEQRHGDTYRENALADFELHSMVEAAEPLVIVDPAHSVRRALVLDAGNGVRSGGLRGRLPPSRLLQRVDAGTAGLRID